jgi:hypothetical protein
VFPPTVLHRRLSLAAGVLVLAAAAAASPALNPSTSTARGARWCPVPEGAPRWARSLRMTVLVDSVLLSGKPSIRRAHRCYRIGWRGRPAWMIKHAAAELRSAELREWVRLAARSLHASTTNAWFSSASPG